MERLLPPSSARRVRVREGFMIKKVSECRPIVIDVRRFLFGPVQIALQHSVFTCGSLSRRSFISCTDYKGAQEIISIFVSIIPFLVAHVQSDFDEFLDQNTVPFLNTFFPFPFLLSYFSFPIILIFILLHCSCTVVGPSLFLLSFWIFSLHTFFRSDLFPFRLLYK